MISAYITINYNIDW